MKTALLVLGGLIVLALSLGWLVGGLYLGVWCCWVLSVVDFINQCKAGSELDAMHIALDLLFFFIGAPLVNTLAVWGAIFIFGVGGAALGATTEIDFRYKRRR